MSKWFFAIFIAFLAFLMNAAVVEPERNLVVSIYGLVAVNIFALSLLLIWLASYYVSFAHRGFGVIGHALVSLAAGIGLIGIGHVGLAQATCVFSESKVAMWASEHDACGVLSSLTIMFGILMLWPSIKLLRGITSRSTRSGATTRPPG